MYDKDIFLIGKSVLFQYLWIILYIANEIWFVLNEYSGCHMVVLNFATTEQTQLYFKEIVIESYFRENFKHLYKLIVSYMW